MSRDIYNTRNRSFLDNPTYAPYIARYLAYDGKAAMLEDNFKLPKFKSANNQYKFYRVIPWWFMLHFEQIVWINSDLV